MKKIYIYASLLLLFVFCVKAQELGNMHHMLDSKGEVTIAGKTKGNVTKDELLNAGGLKLRKLFTATYNIVNFHMVIVPKGKARGNATGNPVGVTYVSSTGGDLSQEMQDAITQAKDGDKIFFDHIICTDKNDSMYASAPITFKLKVLPPPDSTQAKNNVVNSDSSSTH